MATKNLFINQDLRAKKLDSSYRETYEKMQRHLINQQQDTLRVSILLNHIVTQFEEAQQQGKDIKTIVGKNFQDYLRKLEKGIDFKAELQELKRVDYEKYIISGIWFTICAYLVLLFIKEFLTQHFLINIYVDMLVGVIAFYLALNNMMNHLRILKRQKVSLKPFQMELVGLVVAFLVVIFTLQSPFDISFLILVVTYLSSKKLAKAAFEANS